MLRRRSLLPLVFFSVVLASLAGTLEAQEKYPFRLSGFLGLGGAVDDDQGGAFSNGSYQLGFAWESDYDVWVGVRVGQVAFDDGPGGRLGSDLTYATIGGEYLFNEGYYTSGIYFGLGYYGLADDELPEFTSQDAVGLALGITGDFKLSNRFSILVELSGHYTSLDDADLLAMGHVGLGYRF